VMQRQAAIVFPGERMVNIREQQMDEFARNQREGFVDRVTVHLRAHFPDAAVVPWAELRAGVAAQIARGERYGLELEQENAVYVTAAWLLGEDFDTRMPAAEAVLSSPNLSGEEKRRWLDEFTRELFMRLGEK
jgi:hypothetical protein